MEECHLDELARLETECFSQPWSRQALGEEIENPQAYFVVAQEGGRVLGYAGMHFACGEFAVDNVAVFPACRRQGAGQALVAALVGFAQGQGGGTMTLEVRPSNEGAMALYQGMGFQEAGRRKGFYTRPTEDALILRRMV